MARVGYCDHDSFFLHHSDGHPERKERLQYLRMMLKATGLSPQLLRFEPREATGEEIELVHGRGYIDFVREACISGRSSLDPDTYITSDSFQAACYAVGAGLAAVDKIVAGECDRAFLGIRPPGHHAERSRAMGFCLFNNIAITARYAQKAHGFGKVAIYDWDVHHGNGTQHIFEENPSVLYISTHQSPCYPGTGSRSERGRGLGEGFTLNCPLAPGEGDESLRKVLHQEIIPAMETFHPDLILISAGFDGHEDDPLASLEFTTSMFRELTQAMTSLADTYCQGRLVSFLEGGYNLAALADSVEIHLRNLLD